MSNYRLLEWSPLSFCRERGLEPLPGVRKMEAQARQATPRQLALIERLRSEGKPGVMESVDGLTFVDASQLISRLLDKAGDSGKRKSYPGVSRRNDFGTGARLGMAFKCVYRNWVTDRHNIFRHKEVFTKEVLETYDLINAIAERVETG